MNGNIRKYLIKAIHGAIPAIIGICIGAGFVTFALNQHPVISRIINHEGGDSEVKFTVTCAVTQSGHVKCLSEKELVDAN